MDRPEARLMPHSVVCFSVLVYRELVDRPVVCSVCALGNDMNSCFGGNTATAKSGCAQNRVVCAKVAYLLWC